MLVGVVFVVVRVSEFAAVEVAVRSIAALAPRFFTFGFVALSIVDPKCVESVGYACAFVALFAARDSLKYLSPKAFFLLTQTPP